MSIRGFKVALVLFIAIAVHAHAQDSVRSLLNVFDQHRKKALQEKLYVHTDRDFYVTGETLWFTVYAVDGTLHQPLSMSSVAYIEIVDGNQNPLIQSKVALANGRGSGSIFLPATMPSDHFVLRAYTRWMQNAPAEYYFRKKITVANPFVKPDDGARPTVKAQLTFFPEGGQMVAGVPCKIAFRAMNLAGHEAGIRGAVVSPGGDTLTRFESTHGGLGYFMHTASENRADKVVIRHRDGTTTEHPLPAPVVQGMTMTAQDGATEINVTVNSSGATDGELVYLFVHARQAVAFAAGQTIRSQQTAFKVPKEKLLPGISHLTLFNSRLQPISERLWFEYPVDTLSLTPVADQQEYGVRRKVAIQVDANPANKKGPAEISVAVYKLDSLFTGAHGDIVSSLWLTSDLHGDIENPGYYFTQQARQERSIDLVMLTHGWRRFKWETITGRNYAPRYEPEYRGHLVDAQIMAADGNPIPSASVYLSSPDKVVRTYPATSTREGKVRFETTNLYGNRKVIVHVKTDSAYRVTLANPFSTVFDTPSLPVFKAVPAWKNALLERSVAMQADDIFNEGLREHFLSPHKDTTGFYGRADETYYLDDYTRFPVMEEVMREYVTGILVRKKKDGFHFVTIDVVRGGAMFDDPLILVDGVPVFDTDAIMAFDPRKVRKLEVMTRQYYLGPLTFQGVVSYSTYGGDLAGFSIDPRAVQIDFNGLQLQREFYAPAYDGQKARASRNADRRTLLFWAPAVRTDASGKASLDFYTSDIEGEFVIDVQGLTPAGVPGAGTARFKVRRFDN